jgi:hypothetical protein
MSPPRSFAAPLVAAALASAALLAGCTSSPPQLTDPLAGVDWKHYVRDCSVDQGGSGLGTLIDSVAKGEITGDDRLDTLVVDRCESSTSPWPQVVEVFDGASDPSAPRRLGVLLEADPAYPRDVTVTVEPGGRVVLVGEGLSDTAPLCCPDLTVRRVYTYAGGAFNLVESATTPAVSGS